MGKPFLLASGVERKGVDPSTDSTGDCVTGGHLQRKSYRDMIRLTDGLCIRMIDAGGDVPGMEDLRSVTRPGTPNYHDEARGEKVRFAGLGGIGGHGLVLVGSSIDGMVLRGGAIAACGFAASGLAVRVLIREARREEAARIEEQMRHEAERPYGFLKSRSGRRPATATNGISTTPVSTTTCGTGFVASAEPSRTKILGPEQDLIRCCVGQGMILVHTNLFRSNDRSMSEAIRRVTAFLLECLGKGVALRAHHRDPLPPLRDTRRCRILGPHGHRCDLGLRGNRRHPARDRSGLHRPVRRN